MPTKGQIIIIYIAAFMLLILTSLYEAIMQMHSQALTIDLWFVLCFLIFLAADVITEYDIKNKTLKMLNNIILICGISIFIIIVVYKFLLMLGLNI
jgi:hypothetical protein